MVYLILKTRSLLAGSTRPCAPKKDAQSQPSLRPLLEMSPSTCGPTSLSGTICERHHQTTSASTSFRKLGRTWPFQAIGRSPWIWTHRSLGMLSWKGWCCFRLSGTLCSLPGQWPTLLERYVPEMRRTHTQPRSATRIDAYCIRCLRMLRNKILKLEVICTLCEYYTTVTHNSA